MRPLTVNDFREWSEVRQRNAEWLTVWEPSRFPSQPDPVTDKPAFASRCLLRDRDRAAGTAFQFAVFIDGRVAGEVNLNNVIRGAMQSCTVGYWIDQTHAGHSYTVEGVALVLQFAFEQLGLHRAEVCIVPRNLRSRRIMEKLKIRDEGLAERYLEINGVWEDHIRFAMTSEEWQVRRNEIIADWITPPAP